MASSGIVSVTRGVVDLRVPPATPPGQTWLYQTASPLQLTSTLAAVLCGVRAGKVKGVDFENESVNIMPMPDWFKAISPAQRIPVLRDTSIAEEGSAGTIPDSSAIYGIVLITSSGFYVIWREKLVGVSSYLKLFHRVGFLIWLLPTPAGLS